MKKRDIRLNETRKELHLAYTVGIVMISMILLASILFYKCISMNKDIIDKYTMLYEKIETVDDKIFKLNESYNLNVERIYERMVEIQTENPDEVRGAVIAKLKTEDGDTVKFEASVLAILEIYDEFQSDIEIQTYLNDNASILESIKRSESIKEKYDTFLSEYNYEYLDSFKEEK